MIRLRCFNYAFVSYDAFSSRLTDLKLGYAEGKISWRRKRNIENEGEGRDIERRKVEGAGEKEQLDKGE